jgi:UDP-galactopyranose mutase
MNVDYIVVGCGLAGIVMAERIANDLNKKVLIIEQRNHIGGNCYDCYDENGILVHQYGPHIFHTNHKEVLDYLSNYTEWNIYELQLKAKIDGKEVNIPFNLNTMESLLDKDLYNRLSTKIINLFGYDTVIPILKLRENEDKEIRWLADFIYEKVYLNYMKKQWNVKPEELDSSVTERVPIYISKDNRYFKDKYQLMPKNGYTEMFKKMLDNPNIKIMLNTNAFDLIKLDKEKNEVKFLDKKFNGKIIYTGEIDVLFDNIYGELPYRSLRFEYKNYFKEYFQDVAVISYPNSYDFTRITESKHMTGQIAPTTTVIYEYPQKYERNVKGKDVPYYPIPNSENKEKYEKYKTYSENFKNIVLIGRLAKYLYYNMDQMVKLALETYKIQVKKEDI